MQVRKFAALAALPVLAVGGLTACGNSDSAGGANAIVKIGIGEPKHIFPTSAGETEGSQVVYALFAGLMDYDKNGKPFNVIADKISSTDEKTWTVKLKDGFTFHNGEKVTSSSFLDAWNWGAYGPNASDVNSYFAQIDGYADLNPADAKATPTTKTLSGLKKVDDLTFTITLTDPFTDFATELGYTAFDPLPKAAFDANGEIKKDYQDAPIGNGPFKMKGTWKHDVNIEVTQFDGWKGTKPKVKGINFKIYQDLKAMYTDTQAKNLDVDRRVDSSNAANAKNDFGTRYRTSALSEFQFLAFPTYDTSYSKTAVRKAISKAINREEIIKTIFAGTRQPARSYISPVLPGYRDNTCGDPCKYDAAAAKSAYQAAGGPSTIQITYNADGGHKDWTEAACNQLQQNLGVTCQAKPEPKFADLLEKVKTKTAGVGMFRMGWVMDYPSMYDYLQPLYSTDGSSNYYGYSNKQFDSILTEGMAAKTQADAIKTWQKAEDLLSQDMPVIPLWYGQNNYVMSTKVKNVDVNLFSFVNPYTVEMK